MARRNLSLFIDPQGRSVLHRSGFSWLAFIALPLWAMHRRLWWLVPLSLVALYGLHAGVNGALDLLPSKTLQGALAGLWLWGESWFMGRHANRLHLLLLVRRGAVLTATEIPADRMPPHPPFGGHAPSPGT